jgi:hypothetical protein
VGSSKSSAATAAPPWSSAHTVCLAINADLPIPDAVHRERRRGRQFEVVPQRGEDVGIQNTCRNSPRR